MSGTAGEPYPPTLPPVEDGTYVELVYCLRPAGAGDFAQPQRVCIMDSAYVGRRDDGQWYGPEIALPEEDTQTSRFHGVFVVDRERHLGLTYHDLGSANGTSIAGEPVTRCPVVAGTCLRLGRNPGRSELRVVAVNPTRPRPESFWSEGQYGPLWGECAPLRRMFASLDALVGEAKQCPVIVVRGPSGSGKKAVAWELLRRWEGPALDRVPYVDGRWMSAEPNQLAAMLDHDVAAVVVDKLHGLSMRGQEDLRKWLADLVGAASPRRPRRAIVLLEHKGPSYHEPELRHDGLVKQLRSAPTIRLPSAVTCGRGEVELFAHKFLKKYQDDAPSGCRFQIGSVKLTDAALDLLREEPWPGNWRQLQAAIEMAALTVAIDGRDEIETTDLQLGYSEVNLPLEILFEMPLSAAEDIFGRAYLTWKFRKWAGNLSWIAHEAKFTKRGMLKKVKEMGLHDGEQIVWPQFEPWVLFNPQSQRDALRLGFSLPSSAGWLKLVAHSGGDAEAARTSLIELLTKYKASAVEDQLKVQVSRDECDPARLARALQRSGRPLDT